MTHDEIMTALAGCVGPNVPVLIITVLGNQVRFRCQVPDVAEGEEVDEKSLDSLMALQEALSLVGLGTDDLDCDLAELRGRIVELKALKPLGGVTHRNIGRLPSVRNHGGGRRL